MLLFMLFMLSFAVILCTAYLIVSLYWGVEIVIVMCVLKWERRNEMRIRPGKRFSIYLHLKRNLPRRIHI